MRNLISIALQDPKLGRHAILAVIGWVESLALEANLEADVAEPTLLQDVNFGFTTKALHDDETEQRFEDE